MSTVKTDSDPYLNARREWNERYGSYIARARNWRYAALGSIIVSAILAVGVIWLASQSKLVPFVVEVDKLGQAVAVKRADRASPVDQRVVKAQLAGWIADVRSVSSDPVAQKVALSRAYSMVDSSGAAFLNSYYKTNSPFDTGQEETVGCSVDAVLPVSDRTYQVQWTEDARDLQGRVVKTTHWQASLDLAFNTPTEEAELFKNPLGIYIHSVRWTQYL
ncbi:MAG: conjugal transfer protein [Candidatus Eremiobacteraeota bacterium]|nr:conjugal transfer protein [Candidatus Eremiobacteraeota bacterium]MBC5826826.1 conjugal transfer protein [Candidatus Eremiobacteraeota bacterium]